MKNTPKPDTARITLDLEHIKPTIPKSIKKFDPSYVTRYVIVTEIVKKLETEYGRALKILDVGGYNGAARALLPGRDITIIDLFTDDKLKNYVSYDGDTMPFADGTFDLVISCDTLEHVPFTMRAKFMSEVTRVSRDLIVLAAPFYSDDVAAAELRSDKFYQGLTPGESYIWLKEHREYGLPNREWFEGVLSQNGYKFSCFQHSSLLLWEIMLRTSFFLAGNIRPVASDIAVKLEKANDEYLSTFTFKDFPPEGYRSFYICSKKRSIEAKLPKYDAEKTDDFINRQLVLTGACIQELTREMGALQDRLSALQRDSQKLYDENVAMIARLQRIEKSSFYRIARRVRRVKNATLPAKKG